MLQREVLAAWAIAYRKVGWCVLPAMNKHPLPNLGRWGEKYKTELPSLEQIEEWFADAPDDAQIALITGKISNVSVIDIDTHKEGCNGKKGGACECNPENVESLRRKFDLTLSSITGSGGHHLFFQYEESLPSSVGRAHPQIDTRNDGGVIILPPSKHDRLNAYYEWDAMTPWTPANVSSKAHFPKEFLKELKQKAKIDWNSAVNGVGQGKRNAVTAAMAGKLLSHAFHKEDPEVAWSLLWAWNKQNSPPLTDEELATTFKSIFKAEHTRRQSYGRK